MSIDKNMFKKLKYLNAKLIVVYVKKKKMRKTFHYFIFNILRHFYSTFKLLKFQPYSLSMCVYRRVQFSCFAFIMLKPNGTGIRSFSKGLHRFLFFF